MIAAGLFAGEYLKALVGACIIGVVAPLVGTWIVLRRMANLGDAMSHGTLAGVGVAYAAGANILLGALGAGVVIAVLLILFSASQRLGQEAIIAVTGSALFALGVVIISRIDTTEELEHILFGDVLQLTWAEIGFNLLIGGAAVGVVLMLFSELRLASFDHVQAEQVGVHVELIQGVLVVLLAVVVVISLRTVGSVMSVSMLVTPAATARLLSPTLRRMTHRRHCARRLRGRGRSRTGPGARGAPGRDHRPRRGGRVRRGLHGDPATTHASSPPPARLTAVPAKRDGQPAVRSMWTGTLVMRHDGASANGGRRFRGGITREDFASPSTARSTKAMWNRAHCSSTTYAKPSASQAPTSAATRRRAAHAACTSTVKP